MSELAERIRAAVERRNRNEEAIASEGAIGVSHWPTTQERNELRVELSDLLHDNAPTILAGLAALESDPSAALAAKDAEIARLRADVERMREAMRRAAAKRLPLEGPSESQLATYRRSHKAWEAVKEHGMRLDKTANEIAWIAMWGFDEDGGALNHRTSIDPIDAVLALAKELEGGK